MTTWIRYYTAIPALFSQTRIFNHTMQIQWHRRFIAINADNKAIMLIAETESYRLVGDIYQIIHKAITEAQPLYRLPGVDIFKQAEILQITQTLINERFLAPIQDAELSAASSSQNYMLPAFKNLVVSKTMHHLPIYDLTENTHFIAHMLPLIKAVEINSTATLVFIDDYFDPRLRTIKNTVTHWDTAWFPIKMTGEFILAGPFMKKGLKNTEAPCWQCVIDNVSHNQPARQWAARETHQDYFPVPINMGLTLTTAIHKHVFNAIATQIEKRDSHYMLSYNTERGTVEYHYVKKRPQCALCGNPEWMSQQINTPILCDPQITIHSQENGCRIETADATYHRLKKYLSPISGAISMLEPFPTATATANTTSNDIIIYQSSFFKTPYQLPSGIGAPFSQRCLGKGMTPSQSKTSALGEAFERLAAQYQGDEPHVTAKPTELDHRAIYPQHLACFSQHQYDSFSTLEPDHWQQRHCVQAYSDNIAIPWTKAWSLSNQQFVYLPTTHCFASTPFAEEQYCRWGSNGCAAGNTLEEAILQGILEIIERDATAIWWYNKLSRPSINISLLTPKRRERIDNAIGNEWDYWVLDLTHDIKIPVTAAIGRHKTTQKFIFGFGCHPILSIAVERSLTEMCQLIPIRDQTHKTFNFDDVLPEPYLFPAETTTTASDLLLFDNLQSTLHAYIDNITQHLATLNMEVIALNYSRPHYPLHTVNICIPGACHIWPQFACERLNQVPITLRWKTHPLTEKQFNPLHLYI